MTRRVHHFLPGLADRVAIRPPDLVDRDLTPRGPISCGSRGVTHVRTWPGAVQHGHERAADLYRSPVTAERARP